MTLGISELKINRAGHRARAPGAMERYRAALEARAEGYRHGLEASRTAEERKEATVLLQSAEHELDRFVEVQQRDVGRAASIAAAYLARTHRAQHCAICVTGNVANTNCYRKQSHWSP